MIHECAVSMVTLCKTDDGELFMIHDNKETNVIDVIVYWEGDVNIVGRLIKNELEASDTEVELTVAATA